MMNTTPTRYYMPRNRHKQGVMEWQGEKIKVDDGIQPLLLAFNRFENIATNSSCIGGKGEKGFVGFVGDKAKHVKELYRALGPVLGEFGVSVELNRAADGTTWGCVRWNPEDFDLLLTTIELMAGKEAR
jgi:hypothetical protein